MATLVSNNAALEHLSSQEREALRSPTTPAATKRLIEAALTVAGASSWAKVDLANVDELGAAMRLHPNIRMTNTGFTLDSSQDNGLQADPLEHVVSDILAVPEFVVAGLLSAFERDLGSRGLTTYYALLNDRGSKHPTVTTSRTQRLLNDYGTRIQQVRANGTGRFGALPMREELNKRMRHLATAPDFRLAYESYRGITSAQRERAHLPPRTPPGAEREPAVVLIRPLDLTPPGASAPVHPTRSKPFAAAGQASLLTEVEAVAFSELQPVGDNQRATHQAVSALLALGSAARSGPQAFAVAARALARRISEHPNLRIAPYGPEITEPAGLLERALNDALTDPSLAREVIGTVFIAEMRQQMPGTDHAGSRIVHDRVVDAFLPDLRKEPDALGFTAALQQRVDELIDAFAVVGGRIPSGRMSSLPTGIALEATAPTYPEQFSAEPAAGARVLKLDSTGSIGFDDDRVSGEEAAALYNDYLNERRHRTLADWLINETRGPLRTEPMNVRWTVEPSLTPDL
jgi:hypothetical protein